MATTTASRRQFTAVFTIFAMIVATFAVLIATPTQAEAAISPIKPRTPENVTADALPTVQINGISWSQAIVGNTVYAGGNFTHARPAGAPAGTNQTQRNNLLSYNITNGVLNTNFVPNLNAQVVAVAASPDGSRVYVGGNFSQANGQTRNRIAAYNTSNGQLVSSFSPSMTGQVKAIVATNDVVYVGGSFQGVGGQSRTHIAAFNASNGALLSWAPQLDRPVWGLALSEDGQHVFAAGEFENVNGVRQRGIAQLDAVTGALVAKNYRVSNGGADSAITSISVDGGSIYGTGYHFGPGGNVEGPFRIDIESGDTEWVLDCHGDTYSHWLGAETMYMVGHPHYCGNVSEGFPQYSTWKYQHSMAVSKEATGENIREVHGYYNWEGAPSPSIVHWFPTMAMGSVSGAYQAGWHVTGNDEYITIAGEFPRVNNTAQQGLVRFAISPTAPGDRGPAFLDNSLIPELTPIAPGTVRVGWLAGYDMDDKSLTYQVARTPGGVVREFQADSNWWHVPGFSYIDSGLTPGQSYNYQIRVRDGSGNQVFGATRTVTVPTSVDENAYSAAVRQDNPDLYWPLNDAAGSSTIWDKVGGYYGVPGSAVTRGVAGAVPGDTAVQVNNNNNGRIYARGSHVAPTEFSAEAWFRTSSTSGRLLGFGDLQVGNSGHRDRQIYLTSSGRVHFGLRSDGTKVVASTNAYNDNQWHHVVATLSGSTARLYVDGVLVGSRQDITNPEVYVGHWRAGGDNQSGWPSPGNANWNGGIDEVAIYPYALTAQQVDAHYVASGRTSNLPQAPSDEYGASVFDLEPTLYWRLSETTGSTARDSGPMRSDGTYQGGHTKNQAGALVGVSNPAVAFNGSTGYVASTAQFTNPQVFSTEAWFKTTSTSGGKIIGFGNQRTTLSSSYDRHTFIQNDGRLVFGVYTNQEHRVTSPQSYNDGQWHHVVSVLSGDGMKMYVDGALVGTNPNPVAENYSGYWRAGGDRVWSGATSNFLNGTLDEVSVYSTALTAAQVQAHYSLGSGQVPNVSPVAEFGFVADHLSVSFDGSASSDEDGSVVEYRWDFGDGSTGSGVSPSHVYASSGTYQVELEVVDDDGATHAVTKSVAVVANQAPVAAFEVDTTFLQASFDASGSADDDGSIVSYEWDFGDGEVGSGVTVGHTYAAAGTYEVTLQVTDDDGAVHSVSQDVAVQAAPPNQAPEAAFTHSVEHLMVSVDGLSSSDPDGSIVSYEWDFGDGTTSSDAVTSHTYAAAGTYTVELTVTDDDGASDSISESVTVTEPPVNQAPQAGFTVAANGLTVSVDGADSTDTDGTIESYEWDFGDGNGGEGVTDSHTYAAAGTYTVTLTVTDNDGATGTTSQPVVVTAPPVNQAPEADFDWSAAGLTVSLDGSASTDPDGAIVDFDWDFGDGSEGSGEVTSHTYEAAGTYSVELTVTDDAGVTDSVTKEVTVESPPPANQAPTATFEHQVNNLTVSVDASDSEDPDGSISSYLWSFGDGETGAGVTASHTYEAAGTYTVTLTVVDNDGASDETTAQVTVAAAPGGQTFVTDTFNRTVTGGLGTADLGGPWTPAGSSAVYSVSGGKGHIAMNNPGSGPTIYLNAVSAADVEGTAEVALDKAATGGGVYNSLIVRRTGNSDYRLTARVMPTGVQVQLVRVLNGAETILATQALPINAQAGDTLHMRFVVEGSGTTALAGKVWAAGTPEPAAWQVQTSDTTPALQGPGAIGLKSYASGSSTNNPITASWDNLHIGSIGGEPGGGEEPEEPGDENVSPVAEFGFVADHLSVSFDGSASSDEDGSVVEYRWDFGDGSTGSGVSPSHVYASSGTYQVELEVVDDDGATHAVTKSVAVVANQAPVAAFEVDTTFLQASFDASGSADDDGSIVSYEWDFGDGEVGSGVTVGHTYAAAGTYEVTLQVTDDDGAVHSVSQDVAVQAAPPNQAPEAAFTHSVEHLMVSVDGLSSSDPDGSIVSYEWDFGDGTTSSDAVTSHTYAAAGTYTVELTVTDDDGASDSISESVTVTEPPVNQAPQAGFTVAANGLTVSVDGADSTDTDGTIESYEWDFGDGNGGEGVTDSHTYAAAGTYTVTLTVTDNDGATGTTSQPVVVTAPPVNQAPEADFDWSAAGLTVSLDGSASTDPDGAIVDFDWDFGDGSEGSGEVTSHTYEAAGTYSVELTVTDDAGVTDSVTKEVTVESPPPANQAPTATFEHQVNNLTVSVDASDSEDPDGSISSYLWSFGDGETGAGVTASHTYEAAGTYTVTLTVVDNDGASDETTAQVTVAAAPGGQTFVTDTFNRTVTGGLGTADLGGPWTPAGSSAVYSVSGGKGHIAMNNPGSGPTIYLNAVSAADVEGTAEVALDKAATGGGVYNSLIVRRTGNSDYRLTARVMPTGVQVQLVRVLNGAETILATQALPINAQAGDTLHMRFVVEGSGTTALAGKVWAAGTPEPAAWQVQTSDTTPALQGPGAIGLKSYASGSSTNNPITASWDNLHIGSITVAAAAAAAMFNRE